MYKAFIEPDLKTAHLKIYNTFNPFAGELCCAVMCCAVLCCAVLCCAVLTMMLDLV